MKFILISLFITSFYSKNITEHENEDLDDGDNGGEVVEAEEALLGETLKDAQKLIKKSNVEHEGHKVKLIRALKVDGKVQKTTRELASGRLNVETKDGKVIKIDSIEMGKEVEDDSQNLEKWMEKM